MDFDKRLQERDINVINFINTVKVTNRNQIKRAFFKNVHDTVCMRRLTFLVEGSYVKRARFQQLNGNNGFVYYPYDTKKPNKRILNHNLCVAEFYAAMLEAKIEVVSFIPTYSIGKVISDAYVEYKGSDGVLKRAFIEVQLSGKIEDCVKKYIGIKDIIQAERKWGTLPRIIVISNLNDKKVKLKNIKVEYLNLELKGIRNALF
ncbi:MAG: replication-relaxation family protein [Clostridium sp.]|nr:replication-relaxation family protein [Clostridium sp.]